MKKKILPVFLPFTGCGNRCIYCSQVSITKIDEPQNIITSAIEQIERWIGRSAEWDELAYYGGNFGAIKNHERIALYSLAKRYGISKIRFSTRPDTVTDELINEIAVYNIHIVELGVQSLSDVTLAANGRPYKKADVLDVIGKLSSVTNCGVQLMAGMYLQDSSSAIDDAMLLASQNICTARIYPTLVFNNTKLQSHYLSGLYKPGKLADMLIASAGMYVHFKSCGVEVIRMGLPDDIDGDSVTAGARHEAFGDLVKTLIVLLYCSLGGTSGFAGYKGVARNLFPERFDSLGGEQDFAIISKCVKEVFLEDSQRFIEGEAVGFANRIVSQTDNG